jgi:hypothetical protein
VQQGDASISNNNLTGNEAMYGGGIAATLGSTLTVSYNTISTNAAQSGGGVYVNGSDAIVVGNSVTNNASTYAGGGMALSRGSATVTNNIFADNQSDISGGGLSFFYASAQLLHNTIARNSGGDGSGVYVAGFEWSGIYYSSTVWLTNTILVSHTVGITVSAGNAADLDSTLWHANGADWGGAGTINHLNDQQGDPAFAPDGYHLAGASAAINRGIDAGVTTDIDGDIRPQGLGYDLGADEWLCATAISEVGITGPVAGYTDTAYTFSAVITPTDASEPVIHTWWPEPISGQGTGSADYKWTTPGVFSITLDAENCGGTGSDVTYVVVISAGVVTAVEPEQGTTLIYTDTQGNSTAIEVPGGAVTETIALVFTPVETVTHPSGFAFAGHAFDLEAYRDGEYLPGFTFQQPVTVTIHYGEGDVVGIDEATLVLNYWDGSTWVDAAATCTLPSTYDRHPEANWLAVPICHLSRFALFGQAGTIEYNVYLPLVVRKN